MTFGRTIGATIFSLTCVCVACDLPMYGETESLNSHDITVNRSGERDTRDGDPRDAGLRQGDTTNSLNAGPGATGGTGAVSASGGAPTVGSSATAGRAGARATAGSGGDAGTAARNGGSGGTPQQRSGTNATAPVDSAMGAGPNSGASDQTR